MTKTLKGLEYVYTYVTTTEDWTNPETHLVATFTPASINLEMRVCGICEVKYQDHAWKGSVALKIGEDLRGPLIDSIRRDQCPLEIVSGADSPAYKTCAVLLNILATIRPITRF